MIFLSIEIWKKNFVKSIYCERHLLKVDFTEFSQKNKIENFNHIEKNSSNQLFSNFFSENVSFTNFLTKKNGRGVEENTRPLHVGFTQFLWQYE